MKCCILTAFAVSFVSSLVTGDVSATPIVDPPQPITRQVTVQLIQTALDNGASPATVFGDATQRADIEAGIDAIWAQAGIDINILPNITRYNNTFAYQGTAGAGARPQGDLNTIVANARAAGVLNPNTSVLNLIFVNIVPFFTPLNANTAAGLSFINANGSADFVGGSLLTFDSGHDVISSVIAHELGHNLGLNHTASGIANLMSPSGIGQQLDSTQITTARNSAFTHVFSPLVAGDYNKNGVVDAADYVAWRNTVNQSGSWLAAYGNLNGVIDTGDYSIWRTDFGTRGAAGAGGDNGVVSIGAVGVPEPETLVYAAILLFSLPCLSPRLHRA